MPRPLLTLACAYAAGCIAGGDASGGATAFVLALSGLTLGLALLAPARMGPGALASAAFGLGAAAANVEALTYAGAPLLGYLQADEVRTHPVRLRGRAAAPVPEDDSRHPLVLEVEQIGPGEPSFGSLGRARIEVGGEEGHSDILEGDRLEMLASIGPPRGSRSPGAFDAEAWARRERLHAFGFCKSPRLVRREPGCAAGLAACATSRVREWARARLRRHVLPGPQQALVRAMVLGDRSGLDEDSAEAFRRAGTYHVLALSGAQVALVAGLLIGVGRRVGLSPLPLAALVSISLAGYGVLVGGDVPVMRAAIMGIVLVLGRGLDLDADLANLLGAAALVLLAASPGSVLDVGFLLSFGATLAIILVAPALARPLGGLPLGIGALVAGSVAAQAALQPLLAHEFHRLTPAALVLNLAAVPLSGAVLLLGAAVFPLSALSVWTGDRAGDLAWMAADTLLRTCDGGGLAAAVDWRAPDPSLWVLAPWALGLRALARGRWARGLVLHGVVTLALALGPGTRADGRLELAVLDVGQGEALVLHSPSGRTMVVDAGLARGDLDVGRRVVAPYLWFLGVRRLDRLVVTHAHPDHVGGVGFVASVFAPDEIWEGVAPRRDIGYDAFQARLAGSGATRVAVRRGLRTVWDGVTIEVLGPSPSGPPPLRTRNDDSVVILARLGVVCFLLTGDLEAAGEGPLAPPSCLVLKVPHHGSRTSTSPALLAEARPRIGLVSAGARNRFGHPHPEVLERLAGAAVRVLRTDQEGTLRLSTDGRRLWLRTGRTGREHRLY
jgi:competence protein ComEC